MPSTSYFTATDFVVNWSVSGGSVAAPMDAAISDINADGNLDVILTHFYWPMKDEAVKATVLLGNGDGTFSQLADAMVSGGLPANVWGRQIVVADFNLDGQNDIFIADHGFDASPFPGAQNSLLLSTPTGGFENATYLLPQLTDFSHSATALDADGDGDLDIYVDNYNGGVGWNGATTNAEAHYILTNNTTVFDSGGNIISGDGTFSVSRKLPQDMVDGHYNSSSTIAFDYDEDGDQDLLILPDSTSINPVRVLLNDGKGDFSGAEASISINPIYATDSIVDALRMDVNSDGRNDLVFSIALNSYQSGGYIAVLINQGNGQFSDQTQNIIGQPFTSNWAVRNMAVDFNGDGYLDIFQIANNLQESPLLLNDGDGHFVRATRDMSDGYDSLLGNYQYDWLYPGDFNSDGTVDLVSYRYYDTAQGHANFSIYSQSASGRENQSGTAQSDTLLGGSASDHISGSDGDDVIFAAAGEDSVYGEQGDDYLNGGDGNDLLTGGLGNDDINGGEGVDVAVFTGNLANYTISNNNGVYTVIDNRSGSPDGTDTVINTEKFQFADQTIDVMSSVWDGFIYRDLNGGGTADLLWLSSGDHTALLTSSSGGFGSLGNSTTLATGYIFSNFEQINGSGGYEPIWSKSGTGVVIGNGAGSPLTFTQRAVSQPNGAGWSYWQAADMNGDGRSELLWKYSEDIGVTFLDANENKISDNWYGSPGSGWTAVAAANLNGDANADILWRNDALGGALASTLTASDGKSFTSANWLSKPGNGWDYYGTGDFNNDGVADTAWTNQDDYLAVMLTGADGASTTGSYWFSKPGGGWQIEGIGDFNNDGRADTLWWNDALQGAASYLTESSFNSTGAPNAYGYWLGSPGAGWSYAGLGDFNGDQHMDVLFQNAAGAAASLITNATGTAGSSQWIGSPGTSWSLVG